MNRWIVVAIALGLVLSGSAIVGGSGSDETERESTEMTETTFSWGTVTHETDSTTGETHLEITVANEDDVSVSMTTTANGTADEAAMTAADSDLETEKFSWGTVAYTTDSETGATNVAVIVEAEDDVSVSVTTVSDDGTHSQSTTTVSSASDAATSSSVSQSTESSTSTTHSSTTSSSTSVSQTTSSSTGGSVSIDTDDE